MPAVRAEALADIFQPGLGNVALIDVGQGRLVRALLDRIHAIQAVFVIEQDAAALAMVLRLHDFAADIDAGRLCVFAGPRAWEQLADFMRAREGYLAPDRVVSWPWYEPGDVAEISNRLSRLSDEAAKSRHSAIETARGAARAAVRLLLLAPEARETGPGVAAGLVGAARRMEWTHRAVIVDRPSRRHPAVMVRAILETDAEWSILVDAVRDRLPEPLPDAARVHVWLSDAAMVTEELVRRIGPRDRLIVPDHAAMEQARALGFDAARTHCAPPGADADAVVPSTPAAVAVDAEAVGLTLASHAALWDATARRIERGIGAWREEQAEAFLSSGEADSGVKLTSDEVRQAILHRVRGVLGPGVEANAYLHVWRNQFPADAGAGGPVLLLPAGGRVNAPLLNAAAAGRVLFVRAHPGQSDRDGWASFLDAKAHVATFASPRELDAALRAYRKNAAPFEDRAAAARAHVLARHTWSHRLEAALAN